MPQSSIATSPPKTTENIITAIVIFVVSTLFGHVTSFSSLNEFLKNAGITLRLLFMNPDSFPSGNSTSRYSLFNLSEILLKNLELLCFAELSFTFLLLGLSLDCSFSLTVGCLTMRFFLDGLGSDLGISFSLIKKPIK